MGSKKIKKRQLKSLVKECLIEILAEGLADRKSSLVESIATVARRSSKRQLPSTPKSDEIPHQRRTHPDVKRLIETATADPALQSILEDTLHTTYKDQVMHEKTAPMDQEAFSGNPDEHEYLKESAGKWEKLAFS